MHPGPLFHLLPPPIFIPADEIDAGVEISRGHADLGEIELV